MMSHIMVVSSTCVLQNRSGSPTVPILVGLDISVETGHNTEYGLRVYVVDCTESVFEIPTSHWDHLIRNGVHKQCFFKHKFGLNNHTKCITKKINNFITKSLRNFFGRHLSNFWAFGKFCTPKNLFCLHIYIK